MRALYNPLQGISRALVPPFPNKNQGENFERRIGSGGSGLTPARGFRHRKRPAKLFARGLGVVWGSIRVQGSGFRVQGSGFRV